MNRPFCVKATHLWVVLTFHGCNVGRTNGADPGSFSWKSMGPMDRWDSASVRNTAGLQASGHGCNHRRFGSFRGHFLALKQAEAPKIMGVVGVKGPFRIWAIKSSVFELHTVKVCQNGPPAFKTSKSADPRCVWKTALGGLRSNSAHPCFQCQLKTMSSPVPQYFVTNWAGELGVLQSWVCFMLHRSMRCFEEKCIDEGA